MAGRPVVIDLSVRRLFCDAAGCARRTFVEQVEGPTVHYGRRTVVLATVVQAIAPALAGRAGAVNIFDGYEQPPACPAHRQGRRRWP